jgi:rubredoxin
MATETAMHRPECELTKVETNGLANGTVYAKQGVESQFNQTTTVTNLSANAAFEELPQGWNANHCGDSASFEAVGQTVGVEGVQVQDA